LKNLAVLAGEDGSELTTAGLGAAVAVGVALPSGSLGRRLAAADCPCHILAPVDRLGALVEGVGMCVVDAVDAVDAFDAVDAVDDGGVANLEATLET
jgi:hypothetical protein